MSSLINAAKTERKEGRSFFQCHFAADESILLVWLSSFLQAIVQGGSSELKIYKCCPGDLRFSPIADILYLQSKDLNKFAWS